MNTESTPQTITTWLQEARDLMMAAEQCWRADEVFRQRGEQTEIQLFSNPLLREYREADVDLNHLYKAFAGFAIYYLAYGIHMQRREPPAVQENGPALTEMVLACGVDLQPAQSRFLHYVEALAWRPEQTGPWRMDLEPQCVKALQDANGDEELVMEADKRAVDALFARLIGATLQTLASGMDETQGR